jgi:outer membrane receptor for ferric coprogen and ferric-rhodotorulic acid
MKTTRRSPQILRRLVFVQACTLAVVLPTWSQQAKPTTASPAPATNVPVESTAVAADQDVIQLSPFSVDATKEKGYFAENTLAGSRLKTPINDLAASITVVTKQQMEDTGSLDINDVFKYEASTEGSSTYTPVIIDRNTAKDTIGGYTDSGGNVSNNSNANRIRGMGAPDAAINNFPTNNRIPFDTYNTQSVEITRGPNSLLFGLGTPSGIVNQSAAQAQLNRDTNVVTVRTDQYGTFRSSLAFNRSLIKDKLAIFGAFLYNDQQFQRKPSSDLTRREYAAMTYKPFKNTTIRAFAENYQDNANRPNGVVPRDLVTPWFQAGRPAYDPTTRMITVLDTGKTYGPYVNSTQSPGYVATYNTGGGAVNGYFLTAATPANTVLNPQFLNGIYFDDTSRPIRLINGTGPNNTVYYFQRQNSPYAPAQTNPATATPTPTTLGWTAGSDPRYNVYDEQWSSSSLNYPSMLVNGTTYTAVNGIPYGSYQNPEVSNKNIYNWTKYNDIQTNWTKQRAGNYSFEIEQQITPQFFFNAGWLRQDIDYVDSSTMGSLTGNTLQVDTNQKLPDGTVNPYFGQVFIEEGQGGTGMDVWYRPETDDNFRAMLAYELDFTKQKGWAQWLGHHRFLTLWSRQESKQRSERWRLGVVGGDVDGQLRYGQNMSISGTNLAANALTLERKYYMSNPGDPQGTVTHSSGFYGNQGWNGPVSSKVEVFNYSTGASPATPGSWGYDQVVEQALFFGGTGTKRLVNSWTFADQSYLWEDRLVATLGFRHDAYRARVTSTGNLTTTSGVIYSPALTSAQQYLNGYNGYLNHDVVMNRWGRWDELTGNTRTVGGAFHALKGLDFVQNIGGRGSLISEILDGMTLYYNHSSNFNPPATYNTDYFGKPLPKPTGTGKDIGIGFSILQNKLVGRISWYEANNLNERSSAGATPLGRLAYSDSSTGNAWASTIQRIVNAEATGKTLAQIIAVANWNSDAVNPVNDEANQRLIAARLQLPYQYYSSVSTTGTQDSKAKGTEVQVTYNPTNNWTLKLTADKQQTIYNNVLPQFDAWLAVRLPVWQSLTSPFASGAPENDFTDASGQHYVLTSFWNGSYGYSAETRPNTTPKGYYDAVVTPPVSLVKGQQGSRSPDQRQYHANFLTNYQFATGKLRGFAVGGSERWESKGAIGYMGTVATPLTAPGVVNLNDVNRPVYDSGNFITDLFVSYQRKIYNNKIGWKLQLNINNVLENGGLRPLAVNWDGSIYAWRIIDSRQFVLQSTFTF